METATVIQLTDKLYDKITPDQAREVLAGPIIPVLQILADTIKEMPTELQRKLCQRIYNLRPLTNGPANGIDAFVSYVTGKNQQLESGDLTNLNNLEYLAMICGSTETIKNEPENQKLMFVRHLAKTGFERLNMAPDNTSGFKAVNTIIHIITSST